MVLSFLENRILHPVICALPAFTVSSLPLQGKRLCPHSKISPGQRPLRMRTESSMSGEGQGRARKLQRKEQRSSGGLLERTALLPALGAGTQVCSARETTELLPRDTCPLKAVYFTSMKRFTNGAENYEHELILPSM